MNVMTHLVRSNWSNKLSKKRFFTHCILLSIATFLLFISSTNFLYAQGGGRDAGGAANPSPFIPIGGPGTFQGGGAGNLGGAGGGSLGNPQTPGQAADQGAGAMSAAAAQAQAQMMENAMVAENMGALDDPVLQFLHKYILTGIGSFVAYTGKAFDYAIEEYIIGFGNLYINKNVGVAVDSMWSTVRDIFNLTFIFGLVYIGFKMILDSSDSSARKMLISLIGAALLVNFSLFITKFVVDFSNIAAAQIYEAFGNTDLPNFSITNGFMTMMGINDLVGVEMTASAGYAYIVGMLLVFAILIYVFLAGAIMIIIRFVVLCIYMVFSPMMFLGWVFPAMKGHSQKYWSGFLSQAFFAPAFIFMLYLSYRVTYTFSYTTKDWGHFFGQGVAKPIGVDGLIPFFAMVIIFLLASIMVAKNMGAVGASTVVSVGNNIRGRAQNALLAAPRYGARTLAGASASGLGKFNDKLEGSRTGRNFKRALSVASLGALDERARRGLVKAGKNAKFGGSNSYQDDKDFSDTLSGTRSTEKSKAEAKEKIRLGLADGALPDQIMAMQSVVAKMSTSQLETMADKDREKIAQYLTTSQTDTLMKSDKIGYDDKATIGKARTKAIEKLAGKTGSIIHEQFNKLTIEQFETMGAEYIRDNAHLLTDTQLDAVKKSSKFNELQKDSFATSRKEKLNTIVSGAVSAPDTTQQFANIMAHKKPKDIAMMPANVLMHADAQQYLSDQVLREIAVKGTLTPAQQQQLEGMVARYPQHSHSTAKGYFGSNHAINNWG